MTTITKERLLAIKQWRETYGPGSNVVLPAEEAEELARIALAALEAEPVLYQSCTRPTWNSGVPWTEWKERSREGYENDLRFTDTPDHAGWINKCRKLYTTPPVPVMQADVAQAIENLKQKLVECNRYNYCADAVKGVEYACHAAMLQGSQPVSQSKTYRLDFGQWLEQQRGKIDVDCGCVSAETFMHWLRVAYEAGNHPVLPDSSQQAPRKSVKTTLERGYLEAALKIKPGHTLGVIDAMLVHEMAKALLPLVADKIPNKADI